MEKLVNTIMIGLFLTVWAVLIGVVGYAETHYTERATVIALEGNDVIVVEDERGEIWDFFGNVEEFENGQQLVVVFDTNTTDNTIYDDEIVRVRK